MHCDRTVFVAVRTPTASLMMTSRLCCRQRTLSRPALTAVSCTRRRRPSGASTIASSALRRSCSLRSNWRLQIFSECLMGLAFQMPARRTCRAPSTSEKSATLRGRRRALWPACLDEGRLTLFLEAMGLEAYEAECRDRAAAREAQASATD